MKGLLAELVEEKAPGPKPSFSAVHVVKALELISKGPIGRTKLSQTLDIGEGVTRTLIDRLKEYRLITVNRVGCVFTRKGRELWLSILSTLPRKMVLASSGLTLAAFNVAILVKGQGEQVRGGMEQRDAALITGATGATTLIFKDGELRFPLERRHISTDFPTTCRKLVDSLKPEEHDAIVIGSADTLLSAEYGAYAAALSLMENNGPRT